MVPLFENLFFDDEAFQLQKMESLMSFENNSFSFCRKKSTALSYMVSAEQTGLIFMSHPKIYRNVSVLCELDKANFDLFFVNFNLRGIFTVRFSLFLCF